jgi:hypothetical protein
VERVAFESASGYGVSPLDEVGCCLVAIHDWRGEVGQY